MSKFLSRPFLAIMDSSDEGSSPGSSQGSNEGSESKIEKKFIDIGAAIPSAIIITNNDPRYVDFETDIESSPLLLYWISEIDNLNRIINHIAKDIKNRSKTIQTDLLNDTVPPSWKEISHLPTISNLTAFLLHLGKRRKFLVECLNEPFVRDVDVSLLDNLKGFFSAYQHEFAFEEGISANGLTFDFAVMKEGDEKKKNILRLSNLYALNGKIEGDSLVPPSSDENQLFFKIPTLRVSISNIVFKKKGPNSFICPFYKFVFLENQLDESTKLMYDGETQNYIMDVCMQVDRGDRFWLLNGTSLYCHVPQNFL